MVKCTECGAEADFVQGVTTFTRLEQYHCPKCHNTFVTRDFGVFYKKGYISERWFDGQVVYFVVEE